MKNKLIAIALSTLTLTASMPILATQTATGQTANTAQWQLLTPKGQGFSILMPIGKIELGLIGNGTKKDFTFHTEQEAFTVALWDMPPEQIGNEANVLANIADRTRLEHYKLISKRNFGMNGNPGIEVNYVSQSDQKQRLTMRYLVVQRTVYMIAVGTDSPERANTFLSSFRLR